MDTSYLFLTSRYQTQFLGSRSQAEVNKGFFEARHQLNLSGLERGLERQGFTHKYIIGSQRDLEMAIQFQFLHFSIRRIFPRFILFWRATHLEAIGWMKQFRSQIFYKSFMDYRFLVAKHNGSSKDDIWLICSICLLHKSKYLQESYLTPFRNITIHQIQEVWISRHKTHHGLTINFPTGASFQFTMHRKKCGMLHALYQAFNATFVLNLKIDTKM